MLIAVRRQIRSVREKQRIRELILDAIAKASLPTIQLSNIIFTFPERSLDHNGTKIQLITDQRSGEEISREREKEIKLLICGALFKLQGIGEVDVIIRGFDVAFDNYC